MLDKDRLGAAIWAAVKTVGGPYTPAISPALDAQGLNLWTKVADEIIKEFAANSDVAPGTFTVTVPALNTPTPVTGVGGPVT